MISIEMALPILEAIGNNDSVGVTLLDKNGTIIFRNRGNEEISGIKNSDVIGKHYSVLPSYRDLKEVLTTGVPKLGLPYNTTLGTQAIIHRFPLRDEKNEIIGVMTITIFRDAKDMEEVLNKYKLVKSQLSYYEEEIRKLRSAKYSFSNIIGTSEKIRFAVKVAKKYAMSNSPVLITGESGTGKELFAHALHLASPRKTGPFVVINCPSIPEELMESELFGYKPGAFSGAIKGGRIGKFELANKGTVFLDEVSAMSTRLQPKLLRVLQDHKVERLGSNKYVEIDFRVISATNKDLKHLADQGSFREDLYYRLSVLNVDLPPLRDRKEDLSPLIVHFLESFQKENGRDKKEIATDALNVLHQWYWPGNVRELRNVLERATTSSDSRWIEIKDLPDYLILESSLHAKDEEISPETNLLRRSKQSLERNILQTKLSKHGWNKSRTANDLGISRPLLYALIKKYDLKQPDIS